jgi:hypothetical protein
MFPYTMIGTTFIFYSNDWPKRVLSKLNILREKTDKNNKFQINRLSSHCIYEKLEKEEKEEDLISKEKKKV